MPAASRRWRMMARVRSAGRRPPYRAAARPHPDDPRHARRTLPSGEPVVRRHPQHLAGRGVGAGGDRGGNPAALARRRAAARARRAVARIFGDRAGRAAGRTTRPSCAAISSKASIGCNFCANTSSAASSPTTWGSAKPCRRWPTSWSRKREGRLDRPCLVVCPTSVVPNWLAEAARFAPELRVLSLHGADRAAAFRRDRRKPIWWSRLMRCCRATPSACCRSTGTGRARRGAGDQEPDGEGDAGWPAASHARHRLCLTGTPMENHLGELWSQFEFPDAGFARRRQALCRASSAPRSRSSGDAGAAPCWRAG